MKKLILAITAVLMISGAAFAGSGNSSKETFEVGITYGVINMVDKSNSGNYTSTSGTGLHLGFSNDFAYILGTQTNLYFYTPGNGEIFVNYNRRDFPSQYSDFFAFSADAMLMLKIPLGIIDLKAGAGIGYTLRHNKDNLNRADVYDNFISIPVSADATLNLGSFLGLKVGFDLQFAICSWKSDNNTTQEITGYDTFVFLPRTSLVFKF